MLGYLSGVYDILRINDLERIDRAIQENLEKGNKYFALAIYDDKLCEQLALSKPVKTVEERMKIAQYLSGVDFVFQISNTDININNIIAEKELERYLNEREERNQNEVHKKYNISYAPGTYDLFHVGHLENLLEAAQQSKKLIVGVKSDELVYKHKKRMPMISAQERMEILRHFKFIDDVYQYYTRDPHAADIWIKSKYGRNVDAVFMGADLKEDFKNIKDMNIIFTDRDERVMKTRSTTAYREKLLTINGFKKNNEEGLKFTKKNKDKEIEER